MVYRKHKICLSVIIKFPKLIVNIIHESGGWLKPKVGGDVPHTLPAHNYGLRVQC